MEEQWLVGQLTPAKQDSVLWVELAEAIQEIFEINTGEALSRLSGLASLMDMHLEDLNITLDELGDYFLISEKVAGKDRGIAAAQRMDELHSKNSFMPIENILKLEFGGLDVEWTPLYIKKSLYPDGYAFSHNLITKAMIEEDGLDINDYLLTSRAYVAVNIIDLVESGHSTEELEAVVEQQIRPILPTHIALDGTQLWYSYNIYAPEKIAIYAVNIDVDFENDITDSESITPPMIGADSDFGEVVTPWIGDLNAVVRLDIHSVDSWCLDRTFNHPSF